MRNNHDWYQNLQNRILINRRFKSARLLLQIEPGDEVERNQYSNLMVLLDAGWKPSIQAKEWGKLVSAYFYLLLFVISKFTKKAVKFYK